MRILWLGLCLAIGATCARASAVPFWVAWEGNDYPENEGWQRLVYGPQPAQRTIQNGVMTMNGLADLQVDDFYQISQPLNPGPGEEFILEWRMRVNEIYGHPLAMYDPAIQLFSDDDWGVAIFIGRDFLLLPFEDVEVPITSPGYHEFQVRSSNMRTYDLLIDNLLVHYGMMWEPAFTQSQLSWGDMTRGSASHVDWDYVRFGVVPEPGCLVLVAMAIFTARSRQ